MPQTVISLLSERPEGELKKMLAAAQETHARLQGEVARAEVEVALLTEALARQARRGSRPSRGETREQVLEALRSTPDTLSPAEIVAAVREQGATVSDGAIRNMIGRLLEEGALSRVGEGQYQLASWNGTEPNPWLRTLENEAGEPLSTATQPQEEP